MDTILSRFGITDLWLKIVLTFAICIIMGLALQWLVFSVIKFYNSKKPTIFKAQLLKHLATPAKFLLPILFIYSALGMFEVSTFWHKLIEASIIVNFSWVLLASLNAVEDIVKQKFSVNTNPKVKERKAITQLRFIKSISIVVIITLAIAAILWNIPEVKKVGTTILTSAGVIGIIAGVVAQKSIANLITGLQIAFTQPIKIDDEVVIEGEFGTVEDITLTYVVIKTWDWRRLVLPLNYFNDHPFFNWTFNSAEVIGSILLYVDYTFPVAEFRKKFLTIINNHKLWDKKKAELLVTNTDANSVELRATFSAKNASDVWNMRCEIREQLIAIIQEQFPGSLPKIRREPVAI
jgi:small-conductance mechanosensitive channel